jgi:NifB/MoaA-like Fe-S oxidoreductase
MSSPTDEVLALSKRKWEWMSAQDVAPLDALFHAEAVFVHMGVTFSKSEELNVIKTGYIHYRDVDIKDVSVRFIGTGGTTAIVLTTMQLGAVAAGNEVTNSFVVTEVYVREGDAWTLRSLSFTRLVTQLEENTP